MTRQSRRWKRHRSLTLFSGLAFFCFGLGLFLPVDYWTDTTNDASDAPESFHTHQRNSPAAEKAEGDPIIDFRLEADKVWAQLLEEGAQIMKTGNPLVVLEVGMHNAGQCILAAKSNFEAHCVEPSPKSFRKCQEQVLSETKLVQDNIRLYNVAASSTSGVLVDFENGGSTGDMVGGEGRDMWTMTKTKISPNTTSANKVKVKTSRLDDLVAENIPADKDVFVAKIDVQGFEPHVFEGLSESIKRNRIKFILFEYWPKGMDFMMDVPFDSDEICRASVKILSSLVGAGYKLFALDPACHPHSHAHAQSKRPNLDPERKTLRKEVGNRPVQSLIENCMWYYKLEREIFPQGDYFYGYWSDFIAVAPEARFEQPCTKTGEKINSA